MTQKVKAYVVGRFPFYHHDDQKFIGTTPTEVTLNNWLQVQIDAGLVEVAEDESTSEATPKKEKQSKQSSDKSSEQAPAN